MSTSSFSHRPVVTLDNMQFYSGPPKPPTRAPLALQDIEPDDYININDLLAASEMPATTADEHEWPSSTTIGTPQVRNAHGRDIECAHQSSFKDGLINFEPPADDFTLLGQTRVQVDLTLDEEDDASSEAGCGSHSSCKPPEESGPRSEQEATPAPTTPINCGVLTPTAGCNHDASQRLGWETTPPLLDPSDLTALLQDTHDLHGQDEDESVTDHESSEAQAPGMPSQMQPMSRQPCKASAGTRFRSVDPSELPVNAETMSPHSPDKMGSPELDCVTSPPSRSSHRAPLLTPPGSGMAGSDSDEEEMPFVPRKHRRRLITRARDRQSSASCCSTEIERQDTVAYPAMSPRSDDESNDLATASVVVDRQHIECIVTKRGSGKEAWLSIEIPLSAMCRLGALAPSAEGVVRLPRFDRELRRSYESYPTARRTPFSKAEDRMLKKLKEQKCPPLSWREIRERFPHRTIGSLQVRYCTRLKYRRRP